MMGTDKLKSITIKVDHALMGHVNKTDARGAMDTCLACAEAKAKCHSLLTRVETKTIVVHPKIKSNAMNEQLSFDISTIKAPADARTKVTKPQWLIMVKEKTEMKWSEFYQHKDDTVEPMCSCMHKWKQAGMTVKILCCNNA
eukprot:10041300-Ditylum_brightwellii.AAC.1